MTNTDQSMIDYQQSFLFEKLGVRGSYVRLTESWQQLLARRDYPPAIRRHLGDAMAGLSLLLTNLKAAKAIAFQIQPHHVVSSGDISSTDAALTLMVVQIQKSGDIRAMAKWKDDTGIDLHDPTLALRALCESAIGAITLSAEGGNDYQGMVSLQVNHIGEAFEHYFAQSEQLPTQLQLTQTNHQLSGILFQRLPSGKAQTQLPETELADHWQHVSILASSLTDEELSELPLAATLSRLFADEPIRLFSPSPLQFACRCSEPQMLSLLAQFDNAAITDMLTEQNEVEVTCEFCGNTQHYDKIDIIAARKHSPAFDDIAHNHLPETLQ